MKKIFLSTVLALTFVFTIASCSSDDNSSSDRIINYSELPTQAKVFTETYFPESEIMRVEKDVNSVDEYYEVKFIGGVEIDFTQTGSWTNVDGNKNAIPTGFIITPIVEYVATNYSATSIESIEKKAYGFDVDLVNNIELRFDLEGNFLGLDN